MDKQRILKEAQKISSKFPFWMVSGNIEHLYGFPYETPEKKYELEIKFDDNFPNSPPQIIYHNAIKNLLGAFQLNTLKMWSAESSVVDIVDELKNMIASSLNKSLIQEEPQLEAAIPPLEKRIDEKIAQKQEPEQISEENITPNLNAPSPDSNLESQITFKNDLFFSDQQNQQDSYQISTSDVNETKKEEIYEELEQVSPTTNTELGLIQQYYTYDQKGSNPADINVYMTITISKTFIIGINFKDYPKKPIFSFPDDVKSILGDPNKSFKSIKKWSAKKPPHIIDILQELESKLFFIKDIELESKKITGEYKCDIDSDSLTKLKVHLLTYGFKEFLIDIDLGSYPKPPEISFSSELQKIIQVPITSLTSYKNWKEQESEPIEIIREISWLVDKNSRINFEIDLLKKSYDKIIYEPKTEVLLIDMKGKMKTQDLIFKFKIELPQEFPMKVPEITVLNEFELETHTKIKQDLQESFKDFFNKWTPYSYLFDLFNLISEKIFEVSATVCVICHLIECPSCSKKIIGTDSCHIDCPHCDRSYHSHCWEQTINQFGKCGFCLRVP